MELMRELAAVAVVFALLGVSVWLLRGRRLLKWNRASGGRRAGPRLESLARLTLSPQHALHLVRAGDRLMMLVTHAGGCTLLDPPPPANGGRLPAGAPLFQERLS